MICLNSLTVGMRAGGYSAYEDGTRGSLTPLLMKTVSQAHLLTLTPLLMYSLTGPPPPPMVSQAHHGEVLWAHPIPPESLMVGMREGDILHL